MTKLEKKAETEGAKRDHKREHQARKEKSIRLLADVDIALAKRFKTFLKTIGTTFKSWLIEKITEDIGE